MEYVKISAQQWVICFVVNVCRSTLITSSAPRGWHWHKDKESIRTYERSLSGAYLEQKRCRRDKEEEGKKKKETGSWGGEETITWLRCTALFYWKSTRTCKSKSLTQVDGFDSSTEKSPTIICYKKQDKLNLFWIIYFSPQRRNKWHIQWIKGNALLLWR